jgi:hypothetical protein
VQVLFINRRGQQENQERLELSEQN